MRTSRKFLHKSRMRQKKMNDNKFSNTPSLQKPISISPFENPDKETFSQNDYNYQRNYVDKSA